MKAALCYFTVVILACTSTTLSAQAPAETRITDKEALKLATHSPRPEYPPQARQKKITGGGVVLVHVNAAGAVTSVTMAQSTGSPILDHAAIAGFKRWKFKSGQVFCFRSPVMFTMAGYYY